jgi:hypothetical protein
MKNLLLIFTFLIVLLVEVSCGPTVHVGGSDAWYLLVPLSTVPIEQAVQMPLAKWDQYKSSSSSSGTGCEFYLSFLQQYARSPVDSDFYSDEKHFIEDHHVSTEAIKYARCVPILDPRLTRGE